MHRVSTVTEPPTVLPDMERGVTAHLIHLFSTMTSKTPRRASDTGARNMLRHSWYTRIQWPLWPLYAGS